MSRLRIRAEAPGCARLAFGGQYPRTGVIGTLLAVSVMGLASVRLAAQSTPDIQGIADQTIKRLDLQTQFPREPEPIRFSLPPETLWVVVGLALGILAYMCRDLIPGLRSGGAGAWDSDGPLPAADAASADPAVVLEAADELAARGRYVEAMHVLLLRALAEIRQRSEEQFADSQTSREILRSAKLPDAARAALRDVIARVELTYFGERPAAETDYQACRASFNALIQALYGSASG